jgi:hypothetical protein
MRFKVYYKKLREGDKTAKITQFIKEVYDFTNEEDDF